MREELETVSMTISQANIDSYAALTNDFNPLHVDPEFAAGTAMGKTIAHGTMSVNLIWQALARSFDSNTLGRIDLDIRFLKPLFAGDDIEAGGRADPEQPGRYQVWVNGSDGAPAIAGHAVLPDL